MIKFAVSKGRAFGHLSQHIKKQKIKIDRGNKSFRFWRTGVRICTQLCRWKPNQVLSAFEFQRQIRKISHWEVFLDGASRQFPKGVFLLQKPPICQSKTWIDKFTPKCAGTIRFRTLRSAPRALPFGNPQFFEKNWVKLFFFYPTICLCAEGKQRAGSACLFVCIVYNQHSITKGEETIFLLYCKVIGCHGMLIACKSTD